MVGIVGLGIMGGAYARNLMAAGFDVVGYDVAEGARAALRDAGGTAAGTLSELAEQASVVITSLADPRALTAVCLDEGGLDGALRAGSVVIETSTLPIDLKEICRAGLAERDVTLLDCPVSGTGAQAAAKDLLIYASGEPGALAACERVFDGFARETLQVGPFGAGMKLKYVANHLVTIHNLASAEAMLLASKAGLDLETTYRAITGGAGNSRIFELRAPMMVRETYEPATMKFDVFMKDLALITDFARGLSSPAPLFAACLPYYSAALAQGREKQDTAGLFGVLKQLAGLEDEPRSDTDKAFAA